MPPIYALNLTSNSLYQVTSRKRRANTEAVSSLRDQPPPARDLTSGNNINSYKYVNIPDNNVNTSDNTFECDVCSLVLPFAAYGLDPLGLGGAFAMHAVSVIPSLPLSAY